MAVNLGSSTNNISLGDVETSDSATALTVCFTITPTEVPASGSEVINKWVSPPGWLVQLQDNDEIGFLIGADVNGNRYGVKSAGANLVNGGTYRCVCVWEGAGIGSVVIINGTPYNTAWVGSTGAEGAIANAAELIIGYRSGTIAHLAADYSEVAIYNEAVPQWFRDAYAKGFSPRFYRKNRVHYLPLVNTGNVDDVDQNSTPTLTGGTTAQHPPTFNPAPATVGLGTAGGGGDDHSVTPQDVGVAVGIEATSITQDHQVSPQDLAVAVGIEAAALSQDHQLVPQDVGVAVAVDAAALSQDHQLVAQDLAVAVAIEAAGLTQDHALVPQDLAVAVAIDQTAVSQESDDHSLAPQDISVAVAIDAAALTQDHALVPQDLGVAVLVEAAAVTQDHQLVPQDLGVAVVIEAAALTQDHGLVPQDLLVLVVVDAASVSESAPTAAIRGRVAVGHEAVAGLAVAHAAVTTLTIGYE